MPSGWSVRQAARLWARGAHRTSEAKARGGAMQPADHPVGPPQHLQDGLTFDVLKCLAAGGAISRRVDRCQPPVTAAGTEGRASPGARARPLVTTAASGWFT